MMNFPSSLQMWQFGPVKNPLFILQDRSRHCRSMIQGGQRVFLVPTGGNKELG
tara:strand:- start:28424 stop:28582 length:159 start_codon:yes stop_codon:yes gene_type:complete